MNDDEHMPRNYNYITEERKEVSPNPPQWQVVPDQNAQHPQQVAYQQVAPQSVRMPVSSPFSGENMEIMISNTHKRVFCYGRALRFASYFLLAVGLIHLICQVMFLFFSSSFAEIPVKN